MDNIRIIRLKSGEDIISVYEYDEELCEVVLSDPMCIMFKRLPNGKSFMMINPWLPVEIIEDNVARIDPNEILTMSYPKMAVSVYYKRLVNETNLEALESYQQIENYLNNDIDLEDDSSDDDLDIDEMEESLLYSSTSKKALLH